MSYRISVDPLAQRKLRNLPAALQELAYTKFEQLEAIPRPPGCLKLVDRHPTVWRIRLGKYRMLYSIDDAAQLIEILDIETRDKSYKKR